MHITNKKEEFSHAFLHTLASKLGYNLARLNIDNDSIDVIIKAKCNILSKIRSPQLDIQLKCTTYSFNNDGYLHYPLKMKNYEELRGDNRWQPRYLIVVCIPENDNDWIEVRPEEMLLRYSAYWFSLKDEPAVSNKNNITIKIPKHQKLDLDSFKMLMDKASEGIAL